MSPMASTTWFVMRLSPYLACIVLWRKQHHKLFRRSIKLQILKIFPIDSGNGPVEALWTNFPIILTSSVSTTQQEFLNLDCTQLLDCHWPPKSGKPKSLNLPNETVKSVVLDLVVTSFASASRQRNRCPSQGFKNQKAGAYWSSTLKFAFLNPGPPRID